MAMMATARNLLFATVGVTGVLWAPPVSAEDSRPVLETLKAFHPQLEYHPVGAVLPKGKLRPTSLLRMHPAGFRSDTYNLMLQPTYGLGAGWEVSTGFTSAERLGAGGTALFFGLGVQKQFISEKSRRPAVSLGFYGMEGPHNHRSSNLYLAATKQLWQRRKQALFIHGGGKFESFEGDDYGDGSGVRPYMGVSYVPSRRFSLSAEVSPLQSWEDANCFAFRATFLVYKQVGITGGTRSNGFRTLPFVSLTLGL